MADLKPCPCGKTPTSLLVDPTSTSKYATVCGNCCTEWMVEFRTEYEKIDSPECMALAIPAWNAAPRPLEDAKDATIERMRGLLVEALPKLKWHETKMRECGYDVLNDVDLMARIDAELEG